MSVNCHRSRLIERMMMKIGKIRFVVGEICTTRDATREETDRENSDSSPIKRNEISPWAVLASSSHFIVKV